MAGNLPNQALRNWFHGWLLLPASASVYPIKLPLACASTVFRGIFSNSEIAAYSGYLTALSWADSDIQERHTKIHNFRLVRIISSICSGIVLLHFRKS